MSPSESEALVSNDLAALPLKPAGAYSEVVETDRLTQVEGTESNDSVEVRAAQLESAALSSSPELNAEGGRPKGKEAAQWVKMEAGKGAGTPEFSASTKWKVLSDKFRTVSLPAPRLVARTSEETGVAAPAKSGGWKNFWDGVRPPPSPTSSAKPAGSLKGTTFREESQESVPESLSASEDSATSYIELNAKAVKQKGIRRRGSCSDLTKEETYDSGAVPSSSMGTDTPSDAASSVSNTPGSPRSELPASAPASRKTRSWFLQKDTGSPKPATIKARSQRKHSSPYFSSISSSSPVLAPDVDPPIGSAPHVTQHVNGPGSPPVRGLGRKETSRSKAASGVSSSDASAPGRVGATPGRPISAARDLYRNSLANGPASMSCPIALPEAVSTSVPSDMPPRPSPIHAVSLRLKSVEIVRHKSSPPGLPASRTPFGSFRAGRTRSVPTQSAEPSVDSSSGPLRPEGGHVRIEDFSGKLAKSPRMPPASLSPPSDSRFLIIPPSSSPETSGSLVSTPHDPATDTEQLALSPVPLSPSSNSREPGRVQRLFRGNLGLRHTKSGPISLPSPSSMPSLSALIVQPSPRTPKSPSIFQDSDWRMSPWDKQKREARKTKEGSPAITADSHSPGSSSLSPKNQSTRPSQLSPGGTPPDGSLPGVRKPAVSPPNSGTPPRFPTAKRGAGDSGVSAKPGSPIHGRRVSSAGHLGEEVHLTKGTQRSSSHGSQASLHRGSPPTLDPHTLQADLTGPTSPLPATDSPTSRLPWRTPSVHYPHEDSDDTCSIEASRASSSCSSRSSRSAELAISAVSMTAQQSVRSPTSGQQCGKEPLRHVRSLGGAVTRGLEEGGEEPLCDTEAQDEQSTTLDRNIQVSGQIKSGDGVSPLRFVFNPRKNYVSASTPLLSSGAPFSDETCSPEPRRMNHSAVTEGPLPGSGAEMFGEQHGGPRRTVPAWEKESITSQVGQGSHASDLSLPLLSTRGSTGSTGGIASQLTAKSSKLRTATSAPSSRLSKEAGLGAGETPFSHPLASVVRHSASRLPSFRGVPPPVPEDSVMTGEELAENPEDKWNDNSSIKELLRLAKAAQAAKANS
eukprot:TRINITY_DN20475_c0_g1_i1.p1 TRINITY_DN20475_c0_g1~~TRINITY_DN20475_c0_g1_i1.p1  ORF type:complete len:1081 (-),score=131.20 TRINITY_DN20475_c0_g1_i1:1586-4828(-)